MLHLANLAELCGVVASELAVHCTGTCLVSVHDICVVAWELDGGESQACPFCLFLSVYRVTFVASMTVLSFPNG